MVCCSQLELLEPPASAAVGERVTFEGFPGEADAVLNPKKKVFEQVSVCRHLGADLSLQVSPMNTHQP